MKNIKKARTTPGISIVLLYQGVVLLKIDVEKMTAEISLMENSLYIVKDGYLTKVTPRKFGEDTFIWKDGRIHDVIRSQRTRLNGQEEI